MLGVKIITLNIFLLDEAKDELFTSRDSYIMQDEKSFLNDIPKYDRIIYSNIKKVPQNVFKEASKTATFIVRNKPMMEGRLELLNYFIEQSISHSYHRYGNIGSKEMR